METTLSDVTPALVQYLLEKLPQLKAVYAYGSRIRGTPHPTSDLDIALLLAVKVQVAPLLLAHIQGDLESLVGCTVDVSVLNPETQLVHCKEVVAHGSPLFVADLKAVAEFEMRTLSDYARLCEDRLPVIKAYQDRSNG